LTSSNEVALLLVKKLNKTFYMFQNIEIFGREIGMYPIMILCGIFSAGIYANKTAKIHKYDEIKIIIFLLFLSIGVFIGSHLLYALVNYKYIVYYIGNIKKIVTFEKAFIALNYTLGGSVFYGGLIGGVITAYICIRKDNEYKIFVDTVAVCIPLFHFFGRIGCFLGGCCYGIPGKVGFMYTINPITEANGITRFPVQLLEALFNICLFFLLNHFLKSGKFKDKLIYIYLLVYATGRFFIEFLRGDAYRGIWLFLSTSQIISLFIIVIVLCYQYTLYKKRYIKRSLMPWQ
jgi:phosphatidylglycerol:prolipoprotein diacylglycerol transferase